MLPQVHAAEYVGIPCRCGLDPSLNTSGQCSGGASTQLMPWSIVTPGLTTLQIRSDVTRTARPKHTATENRSE
eukprot:4390003-Amphidinium_carterae.1